MEQASILSAKFDCPVVHQNFSLLATVHDAWLWKWLIDPMQKWLIELINQIVSAIIQKSASKLVFGKSLEQYI